MIKNTWDQSLNFKSQIQIKLHTFFYYKLLYKNVEPELCLKFKNNVKSRIQVPQSLHNVSPLLTNTKFPPNISHPIRKRLVRYLIFAPASF